MKGQREKSDSARLKKEIPLNFSVTFPLMFMNGAIQRQIAWFKVLTNMPT
jgi:hypothetical protein